MKKLRWGALCLGLGLLFGVNPPMRANAEAIPAAPSAPIAAVNELAEPLAGSTPLPGTKKYIVRFKDGVGAQTQATTRATFGARVTKALGVFPGMVVELTAPERSLLAKNPAVDYVEPDSRVRVAKTESEPPWGLDRIDQADLPLNGKYTYNTAGTGVKVYLIDTGIDGANADFGGRVLAGSTAISDGRGSSDCNGHGTHVAGIIGGATHGVAKNVQLVPIRVLDCSGSGFTSNTILALNWVAKQHRAGTPAVVNLSLSGGYSQAENDAVNRLIRDGVTVVVAAGNNNDDACSYSPASVPAALTVAASNSSDLRADFSNRGNCVDLYAPGVDVVSAAVGGGSEMMSGTSMASPHVAGAAALILSKHHSYSPARVAAQLKGLSASGRIVGNPSGTPNRLLNIAPIVAAASPGAARVSVRQTVTVSGSGFYSVTRVLFDGVAGTRLKVKSATTLTVRTPPRRSEGLAAIQVVTSYTKSAPSAALYFLAKPTVTAVSPAYGPAAGGTKVIITGTRFIGVRAVYFGTRRASGVKALSSSQLEAVAPAQSAGVEHIRVRTAAGTSSKVAGDQFNYSNAPPITGSSSGNGTIAGGTKLRISGSYR